MKNTIFSIALMFSTTIFSQEVIEKIEIQKISDNEIQFSSVDTPLTQIAGAPEPFYTYWWEFGDGNYSRAVSPRHNYTNKGNFDVLLARTNNYDDGKGRPVKKKDINITRGAMASSSEDDILIGENENFTLSLNQDPKPNEEIVIAQTYKNNSNAVQMGTILFFYNESSFENNHFEFKDIRNHYNEIKFPANKKNTNEDIDSLITDDRMSINNSAIKNLIYGNSTDINFNLSLLSKNEKTEISNFRNIKNLKKEVQNAFETYSNVIAWKFDGLKPEEERNIFLTLNATSEMLTDTNVTISVSSFFIPNNLQFVTKAKENMPIVTAHDPNKLIVNKSKTFNAFTKKNDLTYEIKFQNVGKGPAEEVKLRFYNNADIDITKLNILDFEPKCEICSDACNGSYIDTTITKDYVEFYFHNIYLPGTRQTDIENRNASKGFVKFSLNTKKRIKQDNITCRTEIYFDKEDPIITNNAKTRFQKRAYFGLETGVSYLPLNTARLDLFFRGTFTYRISNNWYYRAELGAKYIPQSTKYNTSSTDTSYGSIFFDDFEVMDPNGVFLLVDSQSVSYISKIKKATMVSKVQYIKLEIVPLQLRRDISNFMSIGFGLHTALNLVSFELLQNETNIDAFNVAFSLDTLLIEKPTHYEVEFVVDEPVLTKDADLSSNSVINQNNTIYNMQFSSGLFFDFNIGKINSIPYVGLRGKVDYNFSLLRVNPSLQLYIGANF